MTTALVEAARYWGSLAALGLGGLLTILLVVLVILAIIYFLRRA